MLLGCSVLKDAISVVIIVVEILLGMLLVKESREEDVENINERI